MPYSDIEVVRRFQQGLNAMDLSVIDRYVAPDYVSHVEGIPDDKEAWKDSIREEIYAYDEIMDQIDAIYPEGDRVYIQCTEVYRWVRPFYGSPPDFKRYRMTYISPYRVQNGLITDIYPETILSHVVLD